MVTVDPEIVARWQKRDSDEVGFHVVARGSRIEVVGPVFDQVMQELDGQIEADGSLFDPGITAWIRLGGEVLMEFSEVIDLGRNLRALTLALEVAGFEGSLAFTEPPVSAGPPSFTSIIQCRIRALGHRVLRPTGMYAWVGDEDAVEAIAVLAERWRHELGPEAHSVLIRGGLPVVPWSGGLPLARREGGRIGFNARMVSQRNGVFRSVEPVVHDGFVSVAIGETRPGALAREREIARLTALLEAAASHIAYAFVWCDVSRDARSYFPLDSWPRRNPPHPGPEYSETAGAFEDTLANDAFGLQFLGPGYADRQIADSGDWQITPAAGGRIVAHRNPAAWFTAPFARDGEPPEVLRRARIDLADVLYEPGLLRAPGLDGEIVEP